MLLAALGGAVVAGRSYGVRDEARATREAAFTSGDAVTVIPGGPAPTLPSIAPFISAGITPDPRFAGVVVCLDPGHGGWDPGFIRPAADGRPALQESFLNLAFARSVRTRLEALGFTVVMTRDDDLAVNQDGLDVNGDGETWDNLVENDRWRANKARSLDELQARINVCNAAGADLLVSMHINGFDEDPNVSGYETWFSSSRPFEQENRRFATLAFQELGAAMRAAGYNAVARRVGDDAEVDAAPGDALDHFVITGPAVEGKVVPSEMPGAIVEALFISNDDDAAFLATEPGRTAVVDAYVTAISRFFAEGASSQEP